MLVCAIWTSTQYYVQNTSGWAVSGRGQVLQVPVCMYVDQSINQSILNYSSRLGKSRWLMKPKHHATWLVLPTVPTCEFCSAWCIVFFCVCGGLTWSSLARARSWPTCAKMRFGTVPGHMNLLSLSVSACVLAKHVLHLLLSTVLRRGTNHRYMHTFVDEDAMRWLKSFLPI